MNSAELVHEASTDAGLEEFGDPSFHEGLDILVNSLNGEAMLTERGMALLRAQILASLTNRLRVIAWTASHKEIAHLPIDSPIFILGLPRTGTTLLSCLLHLDPARRSLLRWEAQNSVPPPEPGTLGTDARLKAAERGEVILDKLSPEWRSVHYEAPGGPTECLAILAQDFKSLMWETLANLPSYGEWLLHCDQTSAYTYHRLELQVLQSKLRGEWVLKSPHHCLALDALVATYPDARFVMTHRDPLEAVPSMCSLVLGLSAGFSDGDHRTYISSHWPEVLEEAVRRVARFRDTRGDVAFFDVQYLELVADPIGVVRRLYGFFGNSLTPEIEHRMRAYVAANPRGRYGEHTYTLDDLRLDGCSISRRFADYRHRYLHD